jgi:uncharacterized membrane protein
MIKMEQNLKENKPLLSQHQCARYSERECKMSRTMIDWRAVAKALTWRGLATATTIGVAFVFTGSVEISLGIGTIEALLKLLFYYFHEKAWDRVGVVPEESMSSSL